MMVQVPGVVELLATGIVPPLRLTAVAVAVIDPPQVLLLAASGPLTPDGYVSEKATPVRAAAVFLFVRVKVRTDVPLSPTAAGEKPLVISGGRGVPHPVNLMLSRSKLDAELVAAAPTALTLKYVTVELVAAAANDWFDAHVLLVRVRALPAWL